MTEQNETGLNCVFDMEDGSQILVTVWGDSIARIAFRADSWSTWSPPVKASQIEKIGQ